MMLALALCAFSLSPSPAGAAAAPAPLVPYIVGGQEASMAQFPWQVFLLREGEGSAAACGGSIISPTKILTAAHCVDHEGSTATYPAADFLVVSGDSNVEAATLPPTAQLKLVASVRAHPYYTPLPATPGGSAVVKDDVAVLTLTTPLTLSPEEDAQAIGLAGADPAAGTPLTVSGYGKEEGAESAAPNGKLYSTTLAAMSAEACAKELGPVNSAVLLCAVSSNSSTCQGDSGGPLVDGSPSLEVGIVDIGGKNCPVGGTGGFTNVAAPEVRVFIEGSETPPFAARPTASPELKWAGAAPVDFGTLTCEPGAWNGSPALTYTFQAETVAEQVLQSGPSNVFSVPSALVGVPIGCIVQASNPGGVTTDGAGPSPPVASDTAAPSAAITAVKCSGQACTLSITASDPNAVALTLQATGSYTATVKCPKKKSKAKKAKKAAKAAVCHAEKTVKLALKALAPGAYQATVSHLPYGKRITFTVAVTNAAGLRPVKTPVSATILHLPPKNKKGKHNGGGGSGGGGVGPIGLSSG